MSIITELNATNRVSVREIQSQDLESVITLHRAVLFDEFISLLGNGFMKTYYQAFAQSPYAVAMLAEIDGRISGALLGTLRPAMHYQWLVRHKGLKLCLQVLVQSFVHPTTGMAVLRTRLLRYSAGVLRQIRQGCVRSFRRTEHCGSEEGIQSGDITHLFVDPCVRGTGIGALLVESYEQLARRHGVSRVDLVTLPPDEGGAGPFYEKLGWTFCGHRQSRSGEQFVLYSKEFADLTKDYQT